MGCEEALKEAFQVLKVLRNAVSARQIAFPVGALRRVKGVALIHSHKGAAVVGFEHGQGAAFKVLDRTEDGQLKLSPPVLLRLSKLTLGIQLGYNSVYTMIAFFNEDTLDALVKDAAGLVVGQDFELVGMTFGAQEEINPFHATSVHSANPVAKQDVHEAKFITVSESYMLIDVSMFGGSLAVDKELLEAAYGKGVSPLDVLHGKVAAPESMTAELQTVAKNLFRLSADPS